MARRKASDPLDPSSLNDELARELGERPSATYVFTRDGARQLDRQAIDSYGIPGIALMENAARATADTALRMLDDAGPEARVLIVCGPGNNGGDGLAAARHLHNAGAMVRIALLAPIEKVTGDAAINLDIVKKMKLPVSVLPAIGAGAALEKLVASSGAPELLVDALLGTGVSGSLRGPALEVIPAMNTLRKLGTRVLAVDLPSGLDADTGVSLGQTVIADVTITMAGPKKGFGTLEAQNFLGDVVVADIGVPTELLAKLGRKIKPPQHPPEEPFPEPPARDRAPKRR